MIYYLNKQATPTIPVPHDCIIRKVSIEQELLTFIFEEDLSAYDTIRRIQPDAKSLIVKIHLIDDFDTYKMKDYKKPWCKNTYVRIGNQHLQKAAQKGRLEYLHHTVGWQSIVIKLFCGTPICLDVPADFVEYEWIMGQSKLAEAHK